MATNTIKYGPSPKEQPGFKSSNAGAFHLLPSYGLGPAACIRDNGRYALSAAARARSVLIRIQLSPRRTSLKVLRAIWGNIIWQTSRQPADWSPQIGVSSGIPIGRSRASLTLPDGGNQRLWLRLRCLRIDPVFRVLHARRFAVLDGDERDRIPRVMDT
jgi:hypothetical protein